MIVETLQKYIAEAASVAPEEVFLEHPSDRSHGDYACNIALVAAKKEGSPPAGGPREYAEALAEKMNAKKPDEVERVEVAGPGFINIWLSREFFTRATKEILESSERWGSNKKREGERVMVEYTDPNPFKEFHIGHLMSNTIGESLSRLVEYSGAEVKRANYQGDLGLHVACAIWGLEKLELDPTNAAELGRAYAAGAKAYKEEEEVKEEIIEINKKLYTGDDEELNELYKKGRTASLEHFEVLYKKLGTAFDYYFFESKAGLRGIELVKEHEDVFEESDGAVVFKGEERDESLHTRVFISSEGLPTYEAKELGLLSLKADAWEFDESLTITASEQDAYFRVVKSAMKEVVPDLSDKVTHESHGMMRLPSGKMSSRTGDVVTGESLLEALEGIVRDIIHERGFEHEEAKELEEAVAVAAIKYSILKQASGKDIVFDVEKELSFEGDSGPYLQYAHTRARSVLEKAKKEGVEADTTGERDDENELERLLYRFPEVVERAACEYEPHYVTTYLTELAGEFNSWYANEQILDGTDVAAYKLALTQAFATTMKNGLWVLGIRAPERM